MTFSQVLTGELPFRNYKAQELAYYVSLGERPKKPLNAEDIGIFDPLWGLIQKCWQGNPSQRPQIQEVVNGVGDASANWNIDMPPSGTDQPEDSFVEEESDELKHGRFPLFLVCAAGCTQSFFSWNISILHQQ